MYNWSWSAFLGQYLPCVRKVHQLREENEVLKSPVSKVGAMMEANPTDHGTHFWNACLGPEVFLPKKILGILAHLRMLSWNLNTFPEEVIVHHILWQGYWIARENGRILKNWSSGVCAGLKPQYLGQYYLVSLRLFASFLPWWITFNLTTISGICFSNVRRIYFCKSKMHQCIVCFL